MADKNYYEILGVDRKAGEADIKSAYRKLAKMYHPDLHPNDANAAAKFKEINEAYETLSDAQKKAAYDYELDHPGMRGAGGFSGFGGGGGFSGFGGFGDIFNDIFSGFGGGSSAAPDTQGEDITREVVLSFLDAAKGCTKEIRYTRNEPCSSCGGTGAKNGTAYKTCDKCKGSGQVRYTQDTLFGRTIRMAACPECGGTGKKITDACPDCKGKGYVKRETVVTLNIPAGVSEGMQLSMAGKGNAARHGGVNGDLLILIEEEPHPDLVRDENDLIYNLLLDLPTAVLGGSVDVPTLDGKARIKVEPGTQPGKIFRLRGKGLPSVNRYGVGDLIVNVSVYIPENLNAAEKKQFEEMKNSSNMQPTLTTKQRIFSKLRHMFE